MVLFKRRLKKDEKMHSSWESFRLQSALRAGPTELFPHLYKVGAEAVNRTPIIRSSGGRLDHIGNFGFEVHFNLFPEKVKVKRNNYRNYN